MSKEFDRIAKGHAVPACDVVRPDERDTDVAKAPPTKRGKPVRVSNVAAVRLATPALRIVTALLRRRGLRTEAWRISILDVAA